MQIYQIEQIMSPYNMVQQYKRIASYKLKKKTN